MQAEVTNASRSLIRPLDVSQSRKDKHGEGSLSSFKWRCNPFPYWRWIRCCLWIYSWINEAFAQRQHQAEWSDERAWSPFRSLERAQRWEIKWLLKKRNKPQQQWMIIIKRRWWELNQLIICPFVIRSLIPICAISTKQGFNVIS